MKYVFLLLGILFFSLLGHNTVADTTIRINEFFIEPTPQQVEIINTGTQSADISGWYIDDNGGSTYYTIPQSSILYPNACLVFAGDFNLNKSSPDTIRLFNTIAPPTSTNANLIDSFSYKLSSGSGISYLRLPDGTDNWTTKSASLGMYNETGLSCIITPTPTFSPTPIPSPTPTPTPIIDSTPTLIPTTAPTPVPSYQDMHISEVMANPSSGENEWVELFNNNDYAVTLTQWFIDDIENGGSSPKLFSLEIPAKNYGIIEFSSSVFNNTGDSVRLLDFNKKRVDDFEYGSTVQGKTLGRVSYDLDEFCLQEPSKGTVNNSCITPAATSNPTSKRTNKPTTSPYPSTTAVLNESINKSPSVSINQLINTGNDNSTPTNRLIGVGEVLGITAQSKNNKRLIKHLSFISFSYSLLTILSVFLKMKRGYEKNI